VTPSKYDVCVVGGAGHVGAPLAILLAETGLRVLVQDVNKRTMAMLGAGEMPFLEEGGEEALRRVLKTGTLGFSASPADIEGIPFVVITIGTPVDEFQNPEVRTVTDCIDALLPYLSDSQTLVLRSTVFPGVTDYLHRYLAQRGKHCKLAFCPERVVQGYAIREMKELPQIVSGTSKDAEDSAAELFSRFAPKIVRMLVMEAEFAKLFANSYRYIQFAAANQFYMMMDEAGLDYSRMLEGLKSDYPRLRDLPSPGFAAGPCLYKDTLQLAAFAKNHFGLGYAALQVNEGFPAYVVGRLASRFALPHITVGLLGMAFKADSDDTRSSLSYKLKRLLRTAAKDVLTTDPFVTGDPDLKSLNEVIDRSDVLVLCAPHKAYKQLDLRGRPLVDVWNFHQGPEQAPAAKLPPPKAGSSRTVRVG
jgi:UDP-N-acetyl-D-mannosaminuronic acid dehydrogenase